MRNSLDIWGQYIHTVYKCTLFLIIGGIFAGQVNAQTYCIPRANGVPALSGPPVWYDADTDGTFPELPQEDDQIDDPRWRGAFGVSLPQVGGASSEVIFRGLQREESGTNFLHFSWYVPVTPTLTHEMSRVYVGFSQAGGGDDVLVEVRRSSASPGDAETDYIAFVRTKATGTVNWSAPLADEPDWVADFTRTWVTTSPDTWAIQMRIPVRDNPADLDVGIDIDPANDFQMWYGVWVGLTTTTFAEYDWPIGATTIPSGFSVDYPPVSDWGDFRLSNSPTDAGCSNAGVSLISSNVATTNPSPHQINLESSNTFYARPTNNTGGSIATGAITADFRTANWGSQPDWNDVPDINALWEVVPNGQNVASTGVINNGTTADGTNQIQFNWTLTTCERCAYEIYYSDPANTATCDASCPGLPANKKRRHQCMLVEMEGPFTYTNKSVYRNMDFVDASTFVREAEISVVGIDEPIPGGGAEREVNLFVETHNLPEQIRNDDPVFECPISIVGRVTDARTGEGIQGARLGNERMAEGNFAAFSAVTNEQGYYRTGCLLPGLLQLLFSREGYQSVRYSNVALGANGALVLNAEMLPQRGGDVVGVRSLQQAPDSTELPDVPIENELDQSFPTYRVHAYRDTGIRFMENGVEIAKFRPQGPFGYYVSHEGDLEGWRHTLEGENLELISPDFYRIPVPDGGVAVVKTTIEAIELSRFAIFIHGGINGPQGDFDTVFDPGLSFNVGLEYALNTQFSGVLTAGYHQFESTSSLLDDVNVFQLSANARYYPVQGTLRPFANGGVGIYAFDPGDTSFGFNVGAGIQYRLTSSFSLEGAFNYHRPDEDNTSGAFTTIQGGIHIRF